MGRCSPHSCRRQNERVSESDIERNVSKIKLKNKTWENLKVRNFSRYLSSKDSPNVEMRTPNNSWMLPPPPSISKWSKIQQVSHKVNYLGIHNFKSRPAIGPFKSSTSHHGSSGSGLVPLELRSCRLAQKGASFHMLPLSPKSRSLGFLNVRCPLLRGLAAGGGGCSSKSASSKGSSRHVGGYF